MPRNRKSSARNFVDPDEIPDLTGPEWKDRFHAAPVVRGRPKLEKPKVSTTLRLDADVLEHFRRGGAGWQTRINLALRSVVRKGGKRAA
jgi:uncharacterized protein (DUF4415 family)